MIVILVAVSSGQMDKITCSMVGRVEENLVY